MPINLLIACRVLLFAEGLRRLLERDSDIRVMGVVTSGEELKDKLDSDLDLILADQVLCRQILADYQFDSAKVLCIVENRGVLTSYGDLSDLVSRGFAGFLPAYADESMLAKALDSVHRGELWIDRKTLRDSFLHKGREEVSLTRREQEILRCLNSGLSNKEIAEKLRITEQTVKSHCNHLYKKFGVKNRLQLALYTSQNEFDQFFT
ncbi:MAG: response regulator transcription factor [Desulfuromonadales bacterium]|nr:response regulator transcription factor [Desulfuromonadales bacterium]